MMTMMMAMKIVMKEECAHPRYAHTPKLMPGVVLELCSLYHTHLVWPGGDGGGNDDDGDGGDGNDGDGDGG